MKETLAQMQTDVQACMEARTEFERAKCDVLLVGLVNLSTTHLFQSHSSLAWSRRRAIEAWRFARGEISAGREAANTAVGLAALRVK